MKKRFWRRVFAGLISLMAVMSLTLPAMAEGEYNLKYVGLGESGFITGNYQTTLFRLKDVSQQEVLAYCVDSSTYIAENGIYARNNIEDAAYFPQECMGRIRAIVLNSYPFVTIEQMRTASGIHTLTKQEAITGTQMAIWFLANNLQTSHPNAHVMAVYNWLLGLAPMTPAAVKVGSINLTESSQYYNGTCTAEYVYSTDAHNADGTPVTLQHGFSVDVEAVYGASVAVQTNGGVTTVTISGLPADANFTFHVRGTQNVERDAYFYSPQGGRTKTQSLIGAYCGNTDLYAEKAFSCEIPDDYSLKIYKYDSKTQEGIEGAVFQLANNPQFNNPTLYEKTTDSEGFVEFLGLTAGIWYLREKTAPVGYIPDTKVYDIQVDEEPQDVIRFKNTHYGEIKIVKTDDKEGPVASALFDIYAGEKPEGTPLYKDLMTDENGLILQGSITPGTYTVVETAPPVGYHLAKDNVQVVTVNPHETVTVHMINDPVIRGKIGVAKEDYQTGERLDGAVIGLYSDAACTVEIAQFTTQKDAVQMSGDLLPGTYYVKELQAPPGYIINPEKQIVQVELEEGETETVVFRNRKRIDTAGNYGMLLLIGLGAVAVTGTLVVVLRKKLVQK